MTSMSWELPAEMIAASGARDHAAVWAQDHGWTLSQADDLVLIVSELVANGIRHGQPPVILRLSLTADGLARAEVSDRGDLTSPLVREAGEHEGSGRGLAMVKALSVESGWEQDDGRTTVWATVPRSTR